MTAIPLALIGVNHPHVSEWHDLLRDAPGLVPVACYDPAAAARGLLLAPYDALPFYNNLDELLAKHAPRAALVLLPLREAEDALLALARAGVHIMVDKPVTRTAPALRRVQSALAPDGVFYTGYVWRWDAIINQARSLVREGILGDLWSIEMRWISSRIGRRQDRPRHRDAGHYLFRRDISRGGMLQWLGCHWIDLMAYVTGQPITSVMAMTARQTSVDLEVEDSATCLLRFGNGMLGSLHLGYLLPVGGQTCFCLRGSLGWVHWDWQAGRRFTVYSEHSTWKTSPTRVFDFTPPERAGYSDGAGAALLHDFARCVGAGGVGPAMTIADAIRVLAVIDAAYESAESGNTVLVQQA